MAASQYSTEDIKQCFVISAMEGNLQNLKNFAKCLVEQRGVQEDKLKKIYERTGKNALLMVTYGEAENKIDVCKYLVEELKFDVNEADDNGYTPLFCSTLAEDFVTTAYLLDQGADPNISALNGLTPLHNAAKKGRVDDLHLLISKGAKVDAQSFITGTPLLIAAAHGSSGAVEVLLANHADPNLGAADSIRPLLVAIHAKSVGSVKALLQWGADPNIGSPDCTPLVAATIEEQSEIIKLLLAKGADPNVPDLVGRLPVEIAAKLGNHADVLALFPMTKPISSISEWSVHGIIKHFNPDAKSKEQLDMENKFLVLKAKGAEAVQKRDYLAAVDFYTKALALKPADATMLSNRSLCWARLKRGDCALQDAIDCITLREDWAKAHYRAGAAYALLRDYREAVKEFEIALKLEPESKELQDAHRGAVLDLRAIQMHEIKTQGYCEGFKQDENDDAFAEYVASFL